MESNASFRLSFFKHWNPIKIHDIEYGIYVLTGCWEYKSPQTWKTNLYKFYQCFLIFVYGLTTVLYMIDAVAVKHDLEKLSFNLSSSFLVIVTVLKVSTLFKERYNLESICSQLKNNLHLTTIGVSQEDQAILRKNAEVLTALTIAFYTLLALGLPLRVVADTTFDRKAYLVPVPNRERVDPYFEVVYAHQTVFIFHFLVVVLSHDLLVFSFLVRFIAHFEILAKNVQKIKSLYPKSNLETHLRGYSEEIGQKDDILLGKYSYSRIGVLLGNYKHETGNWIDSRAAKERKVCQLLKENIKHHQILLRQTRAFCKVYSMPLLIQSLGAGILIGIVILQMIFISQGMTMLLVEQIMFTVTLLLNVFHLCSFATEITTKSRQAAHALYEIPWYEMDKKNRRVIQFAMKVMMEGPKLKGGNMIVINRVTYLKFLRVSYNLIAVLRNVY